MSHVVRIRPLLGLLALGGIALLAPPARAESVTLSSSTGTWSNPVGPGVGTVSYQTVAGENQIRWGNSASFPVNSKSGLGFKGIAPPPLTFNTGTEFEVGDLRHFNNPINSGTQITSAKLTIHLAFSDPSGLNGTFPFTFNIDETPNTGTPTQNADHISFGGGGFANETVNIGGTLYTLQLLGFRDAANQLVSQFDSLEGSTNSATLVGQITSELPPSTVVPLPPAALAGMWLIAGISAVRVVGRRRAAGVD